MFKNIGLIAKRDNIQAKNCLQLLIDFLHQYSLNIFIDKDSQNILPNILPEMVCDIETLGTECDLIIVIGGDGTLLRAARLLADYDICLLGINQGTLGFLTDISPQDTENSLEAIFKGEFLKETRFLIEANVYRNEQCLCSSNALNDVVIHRGSLSHMLTFELCIDEHFVSYQRADGLVVATPTGSTAYALSANGPIVYPSLNALILVPICPHTLTSRPLVINGDSKVKITMVRAPKEQIQLNSDGIPCQALKQGDNIIIQKSKSIHLIHPKQHNYYATLRTKLDWSKSIYSS
ncbi:MAG: NAD(+) kinase [Thiomargarita sp.]|nr:NAD(+) kinase [Thiomargarita sp.]